jgi:hypothetical protein
MSEIKAGLDLDACPECGHPRWQCQCPIVECETCMDTGVFDGRTCPVCGDVAVRAKRRREIEHTLWKLANGPLRPRLFNVGSLGYAMLWWDGLRWVSEWFDGAKEVKE